MKRNTLLRASALLLVATLTTSCFVGGTFAKYVSEETGSDSARVAKWGVEVEVTGGGFHTTYSKDDTGSSVAADTVISSNEENVVAPGTKGTFGGVKITGEPEVAVDIKTTADVELSGWNVGSGGEFYCPLVFTIGNTTINGLDYSESTSGGETSFENAIKDAIEKATTQQLAARTNLSTVGEDVTYSWEWPFNGNDEKDTALGDLETAPEISINVKTTVTQVD